MADTLGLEEVATVLQLIEGFEDRVVAVRAVGTVTADDYERVLTPAVASATQGGRKARLLMELGDGFEGYDPSGMLADASLGTKDFGAFERIAVVTDVEWVRGAIHLFGVLIPADVRVFHSAEAMAASTWIAEAAA